MVESAALRGEREKEGGRRERKGERGLGAREREAPVVEV